MVSMITNKRKDKLGYLVNSTFFPIDDLRYITSSEVPYRSIRLGKYSKNICRIHDMCYENFEILVADNMADYVLHILESNGVTLRGVVFLKERKGNLDKFGLKSDIWRQKFKGCDIFSCYSCYGHLIGVVAMHGNYIAMLEVFDKGCGYGKIIVDELKDIYKTLKGMSLIDCKGFWQKQGADFEPDKLYFSIKN